jgi:hypothetical protein
MWHKRTTEKNSWTDRVKKLSIIQSQVGKEYPTYNKNWKAKWIGHILRRNCILEHIIE